MFKAVVTFSDELDTEDAVEEILTQCEAQLQGLTPVAGLLFCGTEYAHKTVIDLICATYPGLALIGCTTDGEMSSAGGFSEDAITLTLFCADSIQISAGYGMAAGEQPRAAVAEAIRMAQSNLDTPPSLALILPDGLTTNAYAILESFGELLGDDVPVVGGMSADRVVGTKDTYSTYQFFGNQVLSDSVPVLLFSGPVAYSLGVESGWKPIGKRMIVTKSQDTLLETLDGKPAFELYLHYLGDVMNENISGIGSYPLAVYEKGLDRYYLRVAKAADPRTGVITFLGDIPEGAEVQITQAIRDEVISGVTQSVQSALDKYPGDEPGMALMFSCTGRKIALGTKTQEEVGNVRHGLRANLPMTGFYTFGEIGPVSKQTRARYHNTTFVTLLIGEKQHD